MLLFSGLIIVLLLVLGRWVNYLKLLFLKPGWHRLEKIELKYWAINALEKRTAVIYIENTCKRLVMKSYHLVDYLLVDYNIWLLHNKVFIDALLFFAHFLKVQQAFWVKNCNCVLHILEDLFQKLALVSFFHLITIRPFLIVYLLADLRVFINWLFAISTLQHLLNSILSQLVIF